MKRWHVEVEYVGGVKSVFSATTASEPPTLDAISHQLRNEPVKRLTCTDVATLPPLGPIGTNQGRLRA